MVRINGEESINGDVYDLKTITNMDEIDCKLILLILTDYYMHIYIMHM